MLQDRANWIFTYIRNKKAKAFFKSIPYDGTTFYMACNRAAKRFLRSNKIQKLTKDNGCKIISNNNQLYIY